MPKTNQVDINNQGLTDEQYEELEDLEKKSKKRGKDKQPLTEEEKKRLEELKKKNIYVRYFNRPKIDNYLRITIGTDEQMNKLFAALKEIINED